MSQGTLVALLTSPGRVPSRFDLAKHPLLVNYTFYTLPILASVTILTIAGISQRHFNNAIDHFFELRGLLIAAAAAYDRGENVAVSKLIELGDQLKIDEDEGFYFLDKCWIVWAVFALIELVVSPDHFSCSDSRTLA